MSAVDAEASEVYSDTARSSHSYNMVPSRNLGVNLPLNVESLYALVFYNSAVSEPRCRHICVADL